MSESTIDIVSPTIPDEATNFASELHSLCEKYGIRQAEVKFRIDTGFDAKHCQSEKIAKEITATISRKDGRGRPRDQVFVRADVSVTQTVIFERDSTY